MSKDNKSRWTDGQTVRRQEDSALYSQWYGNVMNENVGIRPTVGITTAGLLVPPDLVEFQPRQLDLQHLYVYIQMTERGLRALGLNIGIPFSSHKPRAERGRFAL